MHGRWLRQAHAKVVCDREHDPDIIWEVAIRNPDDWHVECVKPRVGTTDRGLGVDEPVDRSTIDRTARRRDRPRHQRVRTWLPARCQQRGRHHRAAQSVAMAGEDDPSTGPARSCRADDLCHRRSLHTSKRKARRRREPM